MKRARNARLLPAALLLAAAPAAAQTGWGLIGEKEIGPGAASDSIAPRAGAPLRRFMLCVDLAPVRFRSVSIRFASGAVQRIPFRDRVSPGSCGRALSVRRREGAVAAIGFDYDSASLGGASARVQAFGG